MHLLCVENKHIIVFLILFSHYKYVTDYPQNFFLNGAPLSTQRKLEYSKMICLCFSLLSLAQRFVESLNFVKIKRKKKK